MPTIIDVGNDNGGIILDVSEGGLGIHAITPVAPRSAIPVRFALSDSGINIDAVTEIAWGANSKQVGLRFLHLPSRVRDEIRSWLMSDPEWRDAFTAATGGKVVAQQVLGNTVEKNAGVGSEAIEQPSLTSLPEISNPPSVPPSQPTLGSTQGRAHVPTNSSAIPATPASAAHAVSPPAPQSSLRIDVPWHDLPAALSSAAQTAQNLATLWRSQEFQVRLESMSPADRKRALYELEFQIRALSLWLWESGAAQRSLKTLPSQESQQKTPPRAELDASHPAPNTQRAGAERAAAPSKGWLNAPKKPAPDDGGQERIRVTPTDFKKWHS